jgi:hypothetical protein
MDIMIGVAIGLVLGCVATLCTLLTINQKRYERLQDPLDVPMYELSK